MIELRNDQQSLVDSVAALARQRFAARAARYDETASFPAEDFEDLLGAGLHAPSVPRDYGGLGLGPYRGDVITLWLMTREIAKADLSMARCWEGHVNSQVLLDGMGTAKQKARWFPGIVERGEKWVAWSGEPQSRAPGESGSIGTSIEKVSGGYVLDGTKVFSTSAGHARWAILLVNTLGPGGARHSGGSGRGLFYWPATCLIHPWSSMRPGGIRSACELQSVIWLDSRRRLFRRQILSVSRASISRKGGRPASYRTMRPVFTARLKAHTSMRLTT